MWLEFWHGWFTTKNANDILNYCSSIEKSGTKSRFILFDIGVAYTYFGQLDKSVSMFEKVEEISAEWGENWKYKDFYMYFADACQLAGKSDKEARVLETGLELFPDDIELIWCQARNTISKGNNKKVTELINKYEYLCKRLSKSESEIKVNIGHLYEEAGSFDRAEEYYRQALALEPNSAYNLNKLAYLLINENRNIMEGLRLVNRALELSSDYYSIYDTKGWGLYKLGKNEEALMLLGKSWELAPFYWNPVYLHLEEVKKAVANQ
jgi:tetratricopeptide (TPR) repeat protein